MKNFLVILVTLISLAAYSQKKSNCKLGIFGSVYYSDLYIITSLKSDGITSHFPTWDPLPLAGGYGVTLSNISHKVWYNSVAIESRTLGFSNENGTACYRYILTKLSSGIKYKNFIINIGTGMGKNYNRRFYDGSSKSNNIAFMSYNDNKSIIIPLDLEIGFSPGPLEVSMFFQTIIGELFKNMYLLDYRIYNYPYNIGAKCTYIIKK